MAGEFTNDDPSKIAAGNIKYDGGKSPIFRGAVGYFPRALGEVAAVSAFGATKYAWGGWEGVPEGFERYSDALVRHLACEGKGETTDGDSGLLHAAHTAWNALARLELLLKDQEQLDAWANTVEAKDIVHYINDSYYLSPKDNNNDDGNNRRNDQPEFDDIL